MATCRACANRQACEDGGIPWRGRPWWDGWKRASSLITFISVLVGQAAAKNPSGISAARLGKSAAGLMGRSPLKTIEEGIPRAVALAQLEQEIEDTNVMYKFDKRLERLAMVMPLTDLFDPGVAHFAHGHLQEGDKVSMPPSIVTALFRKQAEIPWQFEIQLVKRKGPGEFVAVEVPIPPREELQGKSEMPQLSKVPCSVLDARSPEQFIFIPDWMMKALRLKPRDIVRYWHKDLHKASKIVLQPHSSAFLKMSNHQAVMETELRHYSAIARGTSISFRYRKKLYKFNVLECIDIDGKSQDAVCVQDTDVATDFQAALDTPAGRRRQGAHERAAREAQLEGGLGDGRRDDEGGVHQGRNGKDSQEDEEGEDDDQDGWGSDEF